MQDAMKVLHLCEDYCETWSLFCSSLQETVHMYLNLSLAVVVFSEMLMKILRILQTFRTMFLKPTDMKYSLKYSSFTMKTVIHILFCLHFSFHL